jgi:hypothetical protein
MTPRNPETSYYEIRKARRDLHGVLEAIEVVAHVQGNARAQHLVEVYNRHKTEEDKRDGMIYYWEYTARRTGRTPRRRSSRSLARKPSVRKRS